MKMTKEVIKLLADLQDEVMSAFRNYSLDTVIEVDDANGFLEMIVDVEFYAGVSAQLSFNLETGKIVIGEDAEAKVDDVEIWRQLTFALARQIS